jgi:hypothetical protein
MALRNIDKNEIAKFFETESPIYCYRVGDRENRQLQEGRIGSSGLLGSLACFVECRQDESKPAGCSKWLPLREIYISQSVDEYEYLGAGS